MRFLLVGIGCVAILIGGCSVEKAAANNVLVTNGRVINQDEYPAVVKIKLGNSACTASFIAPRVLLTAAHCVKGKTFDADTKVLMHPLYLSSGEANRADLALIQFPTAKSQETVTIGAPPAVNDEIEIVGFGLSDAQDRTTAGTKRRGVNTLRERSNGMLVFSGLIRGDAEDGKNSASASGDSGGPMFFNGNLVGVTSAGVIKGETKFSIYVDLNSSDSKSFFRQAEDAGFELVLAAGFAD